MFWNCPIQKLWYSDPTIHHHQCNGVILPDRTTCFLKRARVWHTHAIQLTHKQYLILSPQYSIGTEPPANYILTRQGEYNKPIVPYCPCTHPVPEKPPIPLIPMYKVDWHVTDMSTNTSTISIQAYNQETQVSIPHLDTTVYLHLQGDSG